MRPPKNLFHLRLQAQTERLDAPSELRKQRRIDRADSHDPERAGRGQGFGCGKAANSIAANRTAEK